MKFFNIFTKQQVLSIDNVLNTGLQLLLNKPFDINIDIKEKLLEKYPSLTNEQVVDYEKTCKNAYKVGHDFIYDTMVKRLKAFDPMTKQELNDLYLQKMTSNFDWVNKKNFKSIYNLSSYSLGHDGWLEFKK